MFKRWHLGLVVMTLLTGCGSNQNRPIPWGDSLACIEYYGSFRACGGDLTGNWELVQGCDAGKDVRLSCFSRGDRNLFSRYTIQGRADGTATLHYEGKRHSLQTLDLECVENFYHETKTCDDFARTIGAQGSCGSGPTCVCRTEQGALDESIECTYAANELRCTREPSSLFQTTHYKFCVRDDQLLLLSDSGQLLTAFKRSTSGSAKPN